MDFYMLKRGAYPQYSSGKTYQYNNVSKGPIWEQSANQTHSKVYKIRKKKMATDYSRQLED